MDIPLNLTIMHVLLGLHKSASGSWRVLFH